MSVPQAHCSKPAEYHGSFLFILKLYLNWDGVGSCHSAPVRNKGRLAGVGFFPSFKWGSGIDLRLLGFISTIILLAFLLSLALGRSVLLEEVASQDFYNSLNIRSKFPPLLEKKKKPKT